MIAASFGILIGLTFQDHEDSNGESWPATFRRSSLIATPFDSMFAALQRSQVPERPSLAWLLKTAASGVAPRAAL